MKIIRDGNPDIAKGIRTFSCHNCGCIFEADKDEYSTGMQYNELYYTCKCPCCSEMALPAKTGEL